MSSPWGALHIVIFTLVITLLPTSLICYLLALENPRIDIKRLLKRAVVAVSFSALSIVWIDIIVGFATLIKWLLPTTFKDFIQLIQSFAALIVIIGGLRWFFKRGKHLPRANVTQNLDYFLEENDKILIMMDISITNPGDAILLLKSGFVVIYQLKPFTPELKKAIDNGEDAPYKELYRFNMDLDMTLEQNITDTHHIQFIMDSKVKNAESEDVLLEVLQAYTIFYNPNNSDNNWGITTTHKIEQPKDSNKESESKGIISRLVGKFRGN